MKNNESGTEDLDRLGVQIDSLTHKNRRLNEENISMKAQILAHIEKFEQQKHEFFQMLFQKDKRIEYLESQDPKMVFFLFIIIFKSFHLSQDIIYFK